MKKLKIIFLLAVFISSLNNLIAQTSFSCVKRTLAVYNEYRKKYEEIDSYSEASLFVMNEKETMFSHTISSLTSTYYVKQREYDAANDVWTYEVVSDVGNNYYCVFDPKNYEVRMVYTNNINIYMTVFTVKSIF